MLQKSAFLKTKNVESGSLMEFKETGRQHINLGALLTLRSPQACAVQENSFTLLGGYCVQENE